MDEISTFMGIITFNTGVITILITIIFVKRFFYDEKNEDLHIELEENKNNLKKRLFDNSPVEPKKDNFEHEIDFHKENIEFSIKKLESLNFGVELNFVDESVNQSIEKINSIISNIRLNNITYIKSRMEVLKSSKETNKEGISSHEVEEKLKESSLIYLLENKEKEAENNIKYLLKQIEILEKIEIVNKKKSKNKIALFILYLLTYQFVVGVLLPIITINCSTLRSSEFLGALFISISLLPYTLVLGYLIFIFKKDTLTTHQTPN